MEVITTNEQVKQIKTNIAEKKSFSLIGVADTLRAIILSTINRPMLIIFSEGQKVETWIEDFKKLIPSTEVEILPELDFFDVKAETKSLELYARGIKIKNKLIRKKKIIVLSTTQSAIKPCESAKTFEQTIMEIKNGDEIKRETLIKRFVDFGYERTTEVESIGQFAIRGEIIDLYPINQDYPTRVEFFDDMVESIRIFDLNSKRSIEKAKKISILPIKKNVEKNSSVIDYLREDGIVIFDEPDKISAEVKRLREENQTAKLLSFEDLQKSAKKKLSIYVSLAKNEYVEEVVNVNSVRLLKNEVVRRWIATKHTKVQKEKSAQKKRTMDFFSDIKEGDYVVHLTYGIGQFLGIKSMEVAGSVHDYVQIQYSGEDKIFLPTSQLDTIHKYVSVGDSKPKLSRLNTADWTRAKSKAKTAVEDIAEQLIDIYARRGNSEGFAFESDDALQVEFEDACEFELTADQARTLEEVKRDMESPKPMDRLICGDVGFGKTEIAIRVAFKAAMNGKQVAILVPTTVLAYQHYLTFQKRFKNFLPSVDLLSRFRSNKEQSDILKRLEAGHLDILIGTHSILNSNKVKFKDLGLLIIDEEQRFGVKQKDKFRDLSSGVDVLSLSATPIPRSLHMSMVGARDLSVIETAPADRIPVQTYVVEADDEIITNAINRELNRKGQVFFVYNRIEDIDLMKEHIQSLVPNAKIMTAHGQMHAELLEQIMLDFYNGEFDILLSTAIIENGLDVANANTMIVYNADYFGLSQLYQLKGRVGRSNKLAFAYFMFKRDKVLSENADKRLQAIKDFAQLGSSFNIAIRDLEIRGAGNLLGSQQHGHIAGVGFALYSQLLQEAITKLRTKKTVEIEERIEETQVKISVNADAYFSDEYIPDSHAKLLFYQRLAGLNELEKIEELEDELIDRFGQLPEPAQNLIDLAMLKIYAKQMKIITITASIEQIFIQFDEEAKLEQSTLKKLNSRFKSHLSLNPIQRAIKLSKLSVPKKDLLPTIISLMNILNGV